MTQKAISLATIRTNLVEDIKNHIASIEAFTADTNPPVVRYRFKALGEKFEKLLENYEKIESCTQIDSTTVSAIALENRGLEDAYFNAKARCIQFVVDLDDSVMELPHRNNALHDTMIPPMLDHQFRNVNAKLQPITLGKFSGKAEDWAEFEDLFSALIMNNTSLTDIQRMHYLKTSLREEASKVIKHLPTTGDSFARAWALLKRSFHNKRSVVEENLSRFISLPAMKEHDCDAIRNMINVTNTMLTAIEMQGIPVKNWDPFLVYMLSQRMNDCTAQHWEASLGDSKALPSLEELIAFLESRLIIETRLSHRKKVDETSRKPAASMPSTSTPKQTPACTFCNGSHRTMECATLIELPISERLKAIIQKKLCPNCFNKHSVNNCQSRFACKECGKKHNTLLHLTKKIQAHLTTEENASTSQGASDDAQAVEEREEHSELAEESEEEDSSAEEITVHNVVNSDFHALLATALVPVFTKNGARIEIRALLDQGSQANFVSERLCRLIGNETEQINMPIFGLNNANTQTVKKSTNVEISSIHNSKFKYTLNAYVIDKITRVNPKKYDKKAYWPKPVGIKLADPSFDKNGEIDMLIGAVAYGHLLLYGVKKYGMNRPIFQETKLGWILSGAFTQPKYKPKATATTAAFLNTVTEDTESNTKLSDQIKQFWAMESMNDGKRIWSSEEKAAEKHFVENTRLGDDGRFVVRLPFKTNNAADVDLGNSYKMAITRFLQLEKKLINNGKHKEFVNAMRDFIDSNHMREATLEEISNLNGYFVPVQVVVKESSETTKLRPVFDASARSSSGKSINDYMMVGPTIQRDLFDVLVNWRKHKIAMSADIEKMYRQIQLDERDAIYQKVLFREGPKEKFKQYLITTVMFGNAAAPFLAIRTLHRIADDIETSQPHIANMIRQQFYVDDLFSGGETPAQALEYHKDIMSALSRHKLHLRKWNTNSVELRNLTSGDGYPEKIEIKFDKMQKALGISWCPSEDNFVFKFELPPLAATLTKRMLSSDLMKLFDPLGWLAPTIVMGKLIAQKTWMVPGMQWDDIVPDDVEAAWRTYRTQIAQCSELKICRWLHTDSSARSVSLHGFADASERAYAAVTYVRVERQDGSISVQLVAAKTRLASPASTSLPRLELCAAELLANLMSKVVGALGMPNLQQTAWTDSTITLA